MSWIQKFFPQSRAAHVNSLQRGAARPDAAVRHYLRSLPGDTRGIQLQHVGSVRKDTLFVYGGAWRQPSNQTTILLGYARVQHQRSAWWVRHTTGTTYTDGSRLLSAHVQLPGAILVYGRIPTVTASTIEVVLNTGQTVIATVTPHLFGLYIADARSVQQVRIV